jgi:hypothetical protein
MDECRVCGPYFIGKCPHKLSDKEMVEEVLSWRSDDFGHDCQSLLVAESNALQEIGEKFLSLEAKLQIAVEALKQVSGTHEQFMCDDLEDAMMTCEEALFKINGGK